MDVEGRESCCLRMPVGKKGRGRQNQNWKRGQRSRNSRQKSRDYYMICSACNDAHVQCIWHTEFDCMVMKGI